MLVTLEEIHEAIRNNNLEFLVEFHLNMLNVIPGQGSRTFLHDACTSPEALGCLEYLMDQGVDLDVQDAEGRTPLYDAVVTGNLEATKRLLARGANPNIFAQMFTPFHRVLISASNGGRESSPQLTQEVALEMLTEFLKAPLLDLSLMTRQSTPWSPMVLVFYHNSYSSRWSDRVEFVKKHLFPHPNFDLAKQITCCRVTDGRNLLQYLASRTSSDVNEFFSELVNNPAVPIDGKDSNGNNLLEIATRNNAHDKLGIILASKRLKSNIDVSSIWGNIFRSNCGCGDCWGDSALRNIKENVKRLLASGIPPHYKGTPLYYWLDQKFSGQRFEKYREELKPIVMEYSPDILFQETPEGSCPMLIGLFTHGSTKLMEKFLDQKELPAGMRINTTCICSSCANRRPIGGSLGKNTPLKALVSNKWSSIEQKKYLQWMLEQGLDPNVEDPLQECRSSKLANILMDLGVVAQIPPSQNKFRQVYPIGTQKAILLRNKLVRNEVEPCTQESVWEVPDENFIILRSGIAWDIENLVGYIINVTKGVNKYDKFQPFAGEKIWQDNDELKSLFQHSARPKNKDPAKNVRNSTLGSRPTYGQTLKDYMDLTDLTTLFTYSQITFLHDCSSIFWARGEAFNYQIKRVLTKDELEKWNQVTNDGKSVGSSSMPGNAGNTILRKLEALKQEYVLAFGLFWNTLTSNQKNAFQKLNSSLSSSYTENMLKGQDCIMCFANSLWTFTERMKQFQDFADPAKTPINSIEPPAKPRLRPPEPRSENLIIARPRTRSLTIT